MTYTVTVSGVNFNVGISQVGQQGAAGANWRGAWITSTAFVVNDVVSNDGSTHICILAHTSAGTDEPGVGANTATYWEIFAAGGADGTGFTGGSYSAGTGVVTFTSDDGLGFATGDLRGAAGADGTGFTGGSYNVSTGVVTFTSDDGLGFSTSDLRGAAGADGTGWTGGSYNETTGVVTFTSDDGLGFSTGDLRGADGDGAGTVTSVDVAGGTGIDSSGGPVTASGTITVALDAATIASLGLADTAQQPPAEGAFVDGDKTKLNGIEAGADVTDTTNVTTAGALMDSEVTNLEAVKTFDPADYATAAQGTLAGTALQSDDIGVSVQAHSAVLDGTTASFTTADETKLDGIEAGATADQTGAEIKSLYEAQSNTNAFTDAEKTKLAGLTDSTDEAVALSIIFGS